MDLSKLRNRCRFVLGDYAAKNRLLGKVPEFTEEDYADAMDMALLKINQHGIIKYSYTFEDISATLEYVMVLGVSAYLLSSAMMTKARNTVGTQDDGAIVNREANLPLYQAMYQQINAEFMDALQTEKDRSNLRGGYN